MKSFSKASLCGVTLLLAASHAAAADTTFPSAAQIEAQLGRSHASDFLAGKVFVDYHSDATGPAPIYITSQGTSRRVSNSSPQSPLTLFQGDDVVVQVAKGSSGDVKLLEGFPMLIRGSFGIESVERGKTTYRLVTPSGRVLILPPHRVAEGIPVANNSTRWIAVMRKPGTTSHFELLGGISDAAPDAATQAALDFVSQYSVQPRQGSNVALPSLTTGYGSSMEWCLTGTRQAQGFGTRH